MSKHKNLYLRGNVLYMKFYFMGEFVHRSTHTNDPKLAQLAVKKAQKEIYEKLMDMRPNVQTVLFSQAIEETYNERWTGNVTGDNSYRQAKAVLALVGDIPVTEIDTRKVREVHARLRTELDTESTVNRYMAAFRTVMRHAAESYGFAPPKFTLTKEAKGRVRVYTHAEEYKILKWFGDQAMPEMVDLTALLMDTGFRLSEALGIGRRTSEGKLISEVHMDRLTVSSWENKGALPRTIPMTSRVHSILKRRGDMPFSYNKDQVDHRWSRMRKALGLDDDCVAHVCRHTCASRLLAAGKGLLVVKEWLGHADIRTTMIYSHLMPGALDDAVLGLEGVSKSVSKSVTETAGSSSDSERGGSRMLLNLQGNRNARVAELADALDLGSSDSDTYD